MDRAWRNDRPSPLSLLLLCTTNSAGCIMQRVFEVRPFRSFSPLYLSLLPIFTLFFFVFTLSFAATQHGKYGMQLCSVGETLRYAHAHEYIYRPDEDTRTGRTWMFHDTKGKMFHDEVDWLFGFAEAGWATIVSARGEARTIPRFAHLRFCFDEMKIAITLIMTWDTKRKKIRLCCFIRGRKKDWGRGREDFLFISRFLFLFSLCQTSLVSVLVQMSFSANFQAYKVLWKRY